MNEEALLFGCTLVRANLLTVYPIQVYDILYLHKRPARKSQVVQQEKAGEILTQSNYFALANISGV